MASTNERIKKVYAKRKKLGLCTRCGAKKKKSDKHAYCEDCRAAFRKYGKVNKEEIQKKRRKAYKLRKKQGLCTRCGKKLNKSSKTITCNACNAERKIYDKKKREKNALKKTGKTSAKKKRKLK